MNKAIKLALSAFVALGLTACAVEDNGIRPADFYVQTENFSAAAETRVVTLAGQNGQAEITTAAADWITVSPVAVSDTEATQVEVTVQKNNGADRSVVQPIKVDGTLLYLSIVQGGANVSVPNDSETDQPAYTPER